MTKTNAVVFFFFNNDVLAYLCDVMYSYTYFKNWLQNQNVFPLFKYYHNLQLIHAKLNLCVIERYGRFPFGRSLSEIIAHLAKHNNRSFGKIKQMPEIATILLCVFSNFSD